MYLNLIVIAVLTGESISDIKTKSISMTRLIMYFLVAVVCNLLFFYQSIASMLGGIAIGIILLLWGLITNQSIGYGDGLLFVCMGAAIGFVGNLMLLFFSMIIAGILGGIMVFVRKKKLDYQVPFVPCILVTFILMTILEALG